MLQLLKELKNNFDKKLVTNTLMQEEGLEETIELFFTRLMQLYSAYFMKYERERQMDMQVLGRTLTEELINDFLRACLEWLARFENNSFSCNLAESLIYIMAHLFYRNEFQYLTPYSTETSQLLIKILVKLNKYPVTWAKLRKFKGLIDRWGDTVDENCPYFPLIIDKFFDSYFDQKTVVESRSKTIFNPMFPSRAYIRLFGQETSKKILLILRNNVQADKKITRSDKDTAYINEVLYKISLLYCSRIRLPDNDKVADLLYRLYENHAHELSLLYSFRTWIIQYSNISKDQASYKVAVGMVESLPKDLEKLQEICLALPPSSLLAPSHSLLEDEALR